VKNDAAVVNPETRQLHFKKRSDDFVVEMGLANVDGIRSREMVGLLIDFSDRF
jgi:hypothetical protein